MKVRTISLLAGCASLGMILTACSSSSEPASSGTTLDKAAREAISQQVIAANNAMMETWTKPAAEAAWLKFHLAGDNAAWVGDGIPFAVNGNGSVIASGAGSTDKLAAVIKPELANRTTTVNISKETVAVLSPTSAVDVTEVTYVVTRPSGSSKPIPALATSTWVLSDGEWKILQYHQSAPIPDCVSLERTGDGADPAWAASVKGC